MRSLAFVRCASSVPLVVALALTGCRADKIDPAMIKFFYTAETKFNDSFNDKAVCNLYAEDATYMVIVSTPGSAAAPQTTQMNKSQICELARTTAEAAKTQGLTSNTTVHIDSQDIAADGKSAQIAATVTESVHLPNGQTVSKQSTLNEWLVLANGKLRITKSEQWYR